MLTNNVVSFEQPDPDLDIWDCFRKEKLILKQNFISLIQIQQNFNGSNTFGTMKICSRQG